MSNTPDGVTDDGAANAASDAATHTFALAAGGRSQDTNCDRDRNLCPMCRRRPASTGARHYVLANDTNGDSVGHVETNFCMACWEHLYDLVAGNTHWTVKP